MDYSAKIAEAVIKETSALLKEALEKRGYKGLSDEDMARVMKTRGRVARHGNRTTYYIDGKKVLSTEHFTGPVQVSGGEGMGLISMEGGVKYEKY